jgi:hypothetical protein
MRWVVRIDREEDGSESDVIRIERCRMEDAAGLGLTLEDDKRIMALLQKRVLADQLREHRQSSRPCSVCARTCAIKECRQQVIDTIFGRPTCAGRGAFFARGRQRLRNKLSSQRRGRTPVEIEGSHSRAQTVDVREDLHAAQEHREIVSLQGQDNLELREARHVFCGGITEYHRW